VSVLAACEERYAEVRCNTLALVEEYCLAYHRRKVAARVVTKEATDFIEKNWASHPHRRCTWNWEAGLLRTLRKSHPRRYELALWADGTLCGVAIGRLSDAKVWVSVTHIEGSPDPSHPLKGLVATIAMAGAEFFAANVLLPGDSAPLVRALNPLEKVRPQYAAAGYTQFVQCKHYCYCCRG
jgi:hypothetical protein